MGQAGSFYAVKLDDLKAAPPAVKQFVNDFFVERTIFGTKCAVALKFGEKSPWYDMRNDDYKKGLTKKEKQEYGVFTWFENHPEIVFEYHWS